MEISNFGFEWQIMKRRSTFLWLAAMAALTAGLAKITPPASGQTSSPPQSDAMPMPPMMSPELMVPSMDPANGRKLFASKGCVVCHAVNGVGGTDAAALDAATMPGMINPFDFVADMWRGAEPMIKMQAEELGGQVEFTGQELADIIGFLHHAEEQKNFSEADIPPDIKAVMSRLENGSPAEEGEGKGGTGKMQMMPPEGSSGD